MDRYREERAHRELVQAWTTAAIYNTGMCRPEEPVSAMEFIPSHRDAVIAEPEVELDEEQQQQLSDYNLEILKLAAELRAGKGLPAERDEA